MSGHRTNRSSGRAVSTASFRSPRSTLGRGVFGGGEAELPQHGAGVRRHLDEPWTPAEIVAWALEHGPELEPQQGAKYSNTNFFLLGMTIEAVTGEPYHQVVRERLIDPQALSRSYFDQLEPADSGPRATGYVSGADATGAIDMRWAWAAGGMVSTVSDLCAWAEALFRGEVLPVGLREQMLARNVLPDGTETSYGLGVLHSRRAGLAVVGHTGSTMGYRGELFLHRETGVCVAVLTNDFLADPEELAEPVWTALVSELGL